QMLMLTVDLWPSLRMARYRILKTQLMSYHQANKLGYDGSRNETYPEIH
ncbi:MAG: hypothetical protein RI975_482, partial [Pseudomonadota bacterium]